MYNIRKLTGNMTAIEVANVLKGVHESGLSAEQITAALFGREDRSLVSIRGDSEYGKTVRAVMPDGMDAEQFRWYLDGIRDENTTEDTYIIGQNALGKTLTVEAVNVRLLGGALIGNSLSVPVAVDTFDSLELWSVPSKSTLTLAQSGDDGVSATDKPAGIRLKGDGTSYPGVRTQKILSQVIDGDELGVVVVGIEKKIPVMNINLVAQFGIDDDYVGFYLDTEAAPWGVDYLSYGKDTVINKTIWEAYHASENAELAALTGIDNVQVRIFNTHAPYAADVVLNGWYHTAKGKGTVVMGFDDGEDTIRTIAAPYMAQYGFKGTAYIPTEVIGISDSLNWEQVRALKDSYDWDIALDGLPDDSDMTAQPSVADAVAYCMKGQADLKARGLLSDAANFICYPFGNHYNADMARAQIATMTADGSTTVTFDSAYVVKDGWQIFGGNVADNTVIVSGGDTDGAGVTTVELSQPVPEGELPALAVDITDAFYFDKLPQALREAGIKSGRITGGGFMYTRFGFGGREMTIPGQGWSGATLNEAIGWIDTCVLRGTSMESYMHHIMPDPEGWTPDTPNEGINVYESFFTGFIDRLAYHSEQGNLDVLRKTEWYHRDINATAP
ncbi:hypothetical protein [Vibrio spartinae]|uniref:NodB homology domain-containing protein n=1 Tax=Vibrio spartinae TaxID=1918945 RepID=A0A1N6M9E4_9VIBR|nr:hypothetical protein [Vibrio spartinae]SIO96072.1 hypothetical protein VSP9026_03830 [Vibrio spartinae]